MMWFNSGYFGTDLENVSEHIFQKLNADIKIIRIIV
jgi:hypothetical protein